MTGIFEKTFIDPFQLQNSPDQLVNFVTGVHAPLDVAERLVNGLTKGTEMLRKFVEDRIVIKEGKIKPDKSYYDPMPKSNIKTMSQAKLKLQRNRSMTQISSIVMFQRLMAVNAYNITKYLQNVYFRLRIGLCQQVCFLKMD